MLTSHQIAEQLDTDDRTARRFLRTVLPHDRKQKWKIPEEDLDLIKLLWLLRRLGREDMLKLLTKVQKTPSS